MTTLDIRGWKQTGRDLIQEINKAHAATQSVLIQPYPSELLMTQSQYDDLMATSGITPMNQYGDEKDQMFVTDTKYIMEARVK